MPNLGAILKSEITRLCRRELRRETQSLRRSVTQHRKDIAALKRTLADTRKSLSTAEKRLASVVKAPPAQTDDGDDSNKQRITAKGIRTLRGRLGLSLSDLALLTDASPMSPYNWEKGMAPRPTTMTKLVELRGLGKREVQAQLVDLKARAKKKSRKKSKSR